MFTTSDLAGAAGLSIVTLDRNAVNGFNLPTGRTHTADLVVPEDFRAPEMAWLNQNSDELSSRYPGEWIAVDGPELVAHSAELTTLLEMAAAAGHPDPLVTVVPSQAMARFNRS
jgi:hypothetical protein